ncbi:hypothetical protein DNTS_021631 [Danionella cerebrum]|uniref:TYRO protein tyrosine kinase-binding protein n=1 Tax=Danionella cerebrum TaxID=2873325 RepID=A0A553QXR9_9TELE|nr:hypothetical protein DNTS_021631 [Danionella translucida]
MNPEISALTMTWFPIFMVLISQLLGNVEGNRQEHSSCYQMETGVAVGIITSDIILTLLIALSVYCFVLYQKRRESGSGHAPYYSSEGKAKVEHPSVKAKTIEMESPYQELYGVQSDIYNDLQQYRK